MEKERFSLLLLDPGEIYFEDFSATFIPQDTTSKTYDSKKQDGRLKMCSKSLVFDPKDFSQPLIKIPLISCLIIEQWKGKSKFIHSRNVLSINCRNYIEMLEGNVIAPYRFKETTNFLFLLHYANISNSLAMITQLHRATTLPSAEQSNMIAAIVHSRHSRVTFDPLWLDLYEKIIMEIPADKICPLIINPGRVLLSTSRLYFQPYNNIEIDPVIKINLCNIKRIVKRRFLLKHIGLEIYSSDSNSTNSHIYFSFRSQLDRDNLYKMLLEQPELKLDNIEQNVITLQWQNGVISNFEYLMYINSLGDRTINDLTQYPIFPWIISNYTSKELDLNDTNNYRDLSKPIGALNPERLQRILDRYSEMAEPKFMYGSHYSTPGFVLYYLARLYPHYVLCMQGGRFDHPDRMFNSIADTYKNCFTNIADFKELLPEFYDVSQEGKFLRNNLGINFGVRHNGVKVNDVELPSWADTPKHFIEILNSALESDYVSSHLHEWIDLIFGYKQIGDEAIKANNLFYHLCYEGNVDLDSVDDINRRHALEIQIMEFGQIPKQVFTVPHPKRRIKFEILMEPNQITPELVGLEVKWKNVQEFELQHNFNSHKKTVNHLQFNEDGTKIISVGHDSKLKIFCLKQNRQIRSANIGTMPLSSFIQLPNINTLVIGCWDNQIYLYDLDYGKITAEILAHEDAITCMAFSKKLNLLASGSSDCSVKIWRNVNNNVHDIIVRCLDQHLDHNSGVNCICFDPYQQYLAVGTDDGEIYIWKTSNFLLLQKFQILPTRINAIDYSNDGQKLAVGNANGIFLVIDVKTGMPIFNHTSKSSILSLKWQGHLLAIGFNNGMLSLWDMFEVRLLLEFNSHLDGIYTIDISNDKSVIATGSQDKIIKVWKPKHEEL